MHDPGVVEIRLFGGVRVTDGAGTPADVGPAKCQTVFAVLAIGANAQTLARPGDIDLSVVFSNGLQPLLIGGLVLGVGLSLGGPTGYAINPARDLGPRIAHFLLPIPGKRDSDWGYAWIPIVGPLVGGVLGAQLFKAVGF